MFQTKRLADGVQLHLWPTDKFKTVTCRIYVQTALENNTTLTALVPMVVSRGSAKFPTMQAIAAHLSDLYGARFGCDVIKIGERHCVDYYFEMASGTYVGEGPGLIDKGMATLGDLITRPRVEGDGFYAPYVEQEKTNLENRIRSLIDNKRGYALQRFYETMFSGEPFATYRYGTIEELADITHQGLLEHYREIMAHSPMDIFVVGDVQPSALENRWASDLAQLRDGYQPLPATGEWLPSGEVREVREVGDLQQGILFLGYRTPITYRSPDYYKLLVYSGVLGGFPHAKLFTNVREKASLAYYVSARVDATKGFLMINAGIHPNEYDQAVEIILQQVEDMNQGMISLDELEKTKQGLINGFLTMGDSAIAIIDRGIVEITNGVRRDMEQVIAAIRAVTVQDLVEQGRQLKLDTIYFLQAQAPADSAGAATAGKEL